MGRLAQGGKTVSLPTPRTRLCPAALSLKLDLGRREASPLAKQGWQTPGAELSNTTQAGGCPSPSSTAQTPRRPGRPPGGSDVRPSGAAY